MIITSKINTLIKTVISLQNKKGRKQSGLYLVEGLKSVRECISAGCEIEKILCTEENAEAFPECVVVTDAVFKHISTEQTPQGVIAVVKIPPRELKSPSGSCLLLDRLQDPGNVGTVIRTANAAGYDDIYLIDCADPYSPKAVRASMGGIFRVNIYTGSTEIFKAFQNIPFICADMDGENVFGFTPPEKFCLCIGNEGGGLSEEILSMAKYTVKIPMRETCESLNAAVSAGIAMYALKNKTNER